MPSAPDAANVLLEVIHRFQEVDVEFMVVGGFAVMFHGRPRTTADIDLSVHLDFGQRDRIRPLLQELGATDIEEREDPRWGKRLVTTHPSGLEIEVFFTAGHELYEREFQRKVSQTFRGEQIPVISPEDLILRKLVNTKKRRGEDLEDARSVAGVYGQDLDLGYLREHCSVHRVCGLVEELADIVNDDGAS